ncbi:Oidioi.mRNA.OKI2018_I69.chr1.g1011.t1.cds [Oikopleura dioica]|uniref:Oidioi.mRNA.OKI2018_I69.chr1.g1011.t1.cds n=1 Tax=Oikopleura dioica TaxID=34765 RepID=A0ABN7SQU9_OIKDI|nr:Oidioi.mRNA.OKI2018_I69.chr1.g1011.t1.cds [Oikopleura dioica]
MRLNSVFIKRAERKERIIKTEIKSRKKCAVFFISSRFSHLFSFGYSMGTVGYGVIPQHHKSSPMKIIEYKKKRAFKPTSGKKIGRTGNAEFNRLLNLYL